MKMVLPLRPLLAALALSSFAAAAQAPGDLRIALVIGNATYAASPLANPANDAKAMSETLRGLGFAVIEVRNGSKAQMAEAIAKIRESLRGKQGVGMLYYAGHGLQLDSRNYMVPVDAKLGKAGDIAAQTVEVGAVVEAFKTAGNRMNIVVLDACRDNPFGSISSGKGLAPLDAPSGTFLAYATAPGNVAGDGDTKSGNGLYTQFLLEELKKPQARIEDVFKRVRFAVRRASDGRQIPWESTSLEDDFQFNDGRVVTAAKPSAQQLVAAFNEEKQDWDRIKDSAKPDDFYAFLQKYPTGTISQAAQAKLNLLSQPTLVVQGAGADGKDQAYAIRRYRPGDFFETRSSATGMQGHTFSEERVSAGPGGDLLVEATVRMANAAAPTKTVKIYDAQGGFKGVKDVFSVEPPSYLAPSGLLQVGESWKKSYQTVMAMKGVPPLPPANSVARIVSRQKMTVPAGTFDTFRVEQETLHLPGGPVGKIACTLWITPDIPHPVKTECSQEMNGKPFESTSELVRFTRGS